MEVLASLTVHVSGLGLKSSGLLVEINFRILNRMCILFMSVVDMADLVLNPPLVYRHGLDVSALGLAESVACTAIDV